MIDSLNRNRRSCTADKLLINPHANLLTYRILSLITTKKERSVNVMLAVNYTQFRNEMKSHMDLVTYDYETVIVTRK